MELDHKAKTIKVVETTNLIGTSDQKISTKTNRVTALGYKWTLKKKEFWQSQLKYRRQDEK